MDFKWCRRYSRQYWPEEVEHIQRIAQETADQIFLFDLRWDMECTYEPVIFEQEIDWKYMPKDDPEFVYQLNRHRYWICLGQAYAMTGDERYAETFVNQLTSWIQNNPLNRENQKTTWRSIEAGLRGENWTKAMEYFSPCLTKEIKEMYEKSLAEQAEYLAGSDAPFQLQSNWGVIESSGLFAIALSLKEHPKAKEWREISIERLARQIEVQVTEEGVHWEQSPMYHNEVLHCYLETIKLAKRHEISLPDIIWEKTKKMAYANLCWKKPNHCQPTEGDSDETDVRDLLTLAALLFCDGTLKFGGYERLDFESVWELGEKGAALYDQIQTKEPEWTHMAFWDSGDVYLRSGWDEQADYLHFHCGFMGSGHGHGDKTHFDLAVNGEDLLSDCGRYHYVDGKARRWFKSLKAHNCICVDREDAIEYSDAWGINGFVPPINRVLREKDGYCFVEGGHLGYQKRGIFVNRKIIRLEKNVYVIMDECYTDGAHFYQQYFHFPACGTVTAIEEQKCCYAGRQIEADFFFLTPDVKMEIEASRISSHYNLLETNQRICASIKKQGFTSMLTVIAGKNAGEDFSVQARKLPVTDALNGKALSDKNAEAVEVVTNSNSYVVIVKHQEVSPLSALIEAGDHRALARVTVFDSTAEAGHVLSW